MGFWGKLAVTAVVLLMPLVIAAPAIDLGIPEGSPWRRFSIRAAFGWLCFWVFVMLVSAVGGIWSE